MIELVAEPFPAGSQEKLRKWLAMPEANLLRKAVTARGQLHEAAALNLAIRSKPGQPGELLAQDDMREAQRYFEFLTIFNAISATSPPATFFTAKLNPTSNHGQTPEPTSDE
jgi:hypothetical protein